MQPISKSCENSEADCRERIQFGSDRPAAPPFYRRGDSAYMATVAIGVIHMHLLVQMVLLRETLVPNVKGLDFLVLKSSPIISG